MSNAAGGKNSNALITRIVFAGVMAAIICVITTFRIPLGQSKVHFANSMCLLSGLLLGPVWGGTAAGLGSAIYDVLLGGYSFFDALITFVSKFAMAWVTGILYQKWDDSRNHGGEADSFPDQRSLRGGDGADLLPRGASGP